MAGKSLEEVQGKVKKFLRWGVARMAEERRGGRFMSAF